MTDAPNRELCAAFRQLMTEGFYVTKDDGEILSGQDAQPTLAETKHWRGELWKAFRELEDRLCPVQAHDRRSKKMRKDA